MHIHKKKIEKREKKQNIGEIFIVFDLFCFKLIEICLKDKYRSMISE